MNNTEKIQLPDAGQSITVTLEESDSLKVNNWKDVRYYFTWNYHTQYHRKSADLGWISCDGTEDNLKSFGNSEVRALIQKIKEQVMRE